MKGRVRWYLISAVLILGAGLIGSGVSWGDDTSPPVAGASTDGQAVVAQAAPAATTTTQAASPPAAAAPNSGSVPTTEVTVTAEKSKPGSAAAGYREEEVAKIGPWTDMKLQDTPYSMLVVPHDMIENLQITNQDELAKVIPNVQFEGPQNVNNLSQVIYRGFVNQETAYDGLVQGPLGFGIFLEDVERVEVLTGTSGFLYGTGNVGGLLNYVYKRPTQTPLYDVTVGDAGGSNYYVHGDFGGPIDKQGKIAYRLNILNQNGETEVNQQYLAKQLYSGALDFHILDNLLLQLNGANQFWRLDGRQPTWALASGARLPSAPSADELWAPRWTSLNEETSYGEAKLTWDINNMFDFRAAYRDQRDEREDPRFTQNTIQPNGTYNMAIYGLSPQVFNNNSGYAFADAKFDTWGISQKVTAGFSGYKYFDLAHNPVSSASVTVTGLNFDNPAAAEDISRVNIPNFPRGVYYRAAETETSNWIIGDSIEFNKQWSALVGVNEAGMEALSYNASGVTTSAYDKSATTPTASLLYKPVPWITTYATYMEALEQGAVVPISPVYTDPGKVFSPLVDHEYEVGAKATVGGMLLTAAAFDIDKANQFAVVNPNGTQTYTQDGREVHKGLEFTATGKAMENLTLFGGFTIMNCEVTSEKANPALDGNRPAGVANQLVKLYAEYDIPRIPGLTVTGGAYYTGTFYYDAANTDKLPAVIIGDFGLRYTTRVTGYPLIYRLNITNVTNKNYWTASDELGNTRAVLLSAQVKF